MPTHRTIHPDTLRRDLARLREHRSPAVGPGPRRATGAMAIVRHHLPLLLDLHASGATWVDLAAALALQGVKQGRDEALSGRRLTALIASIRRQDRQRAARIAAREARADLAGRAPTGPASVRPVQPARDTASASPPARAPGLRLAPELTTGPPPDAAEPPLTEAEIRRLQADKHKHLFRKDPA